MTRNQASRMIAHAWRYVEETHPHDYNKIDTLIILVEVEASIRRGLSSRELNEEVVL